MIKGLDFAAYFIEGKDETIQSILTMAKRYTLMVWLWISQGVSCLFDHHLKSRIRRWDSMGILEIPLSMPFEEINGLTSSGLTFLKSLDLVSESKWLIPLLDVKKSRITIFPDSTTKYSSFSPKLCDGGTQIG